MLNQQSTVVTTQYLVSPNVSTCSTQNNRSGPERAIVIESRGCLLISRIRLVEIYLYLCCVGTLGILTSLLIYMQGSQEMINHSFRLGQLLKCGPPLTEECLLRVFFCKISLWLHQSHLATFLEAF